MTCKKILKRWHTPLNDCFFQKCNTHVVAKSNLVLFNMLYKIFRKMELVLQLANNWFFIKKIKIKTKVLIQIKSSFVPLKNLVYGMKNWDSQTTNFKNMPYYSKWSQTFLKMELQPNIVKIFQKMKKPPKFRIF